MIIGNQSLTRAPRKHVHRALTDRELEALQAQREFVGDLLREDYEVYSLPALRADLPVLQQIIDDCVFSAAEEYEWSCVGVAFGDVLAAELGMKWCMFACSTGAEPALHSDDVNATLFPRAMVLRRAEDTEALQLGALFDQVAEGIEQMHGRGSSREANNLGGHELTR